MRAAPRRSFGAADHLFMKMSQLPVFAWSGTPLASVADQILSYTGAVHPSHHVQLKPSSAHVQEVLGFRTLP